MLIILLLALNCNKLNIKGNNIQKHYGENMNSIVLHDKIAKYIEKGREKKLIRSIDSIDLMEFRIKEKYTILLYALDIGNEDITKSILQHILLKKDFDISSFINIGVYNSGDTALHYAAFYGYHEIIENLIEMGANLYCKDIDLDIPLHLSVLNNKYETVKLFLDKGIDVNIRSIGGNTALHYAIEYSYINIIDKLIEVSDVNAQNNSLKTPLHLSVLNNRYDVVKMLLNKGAIVDTKSAKSDTALHYASQYGYTDIMEELILRGTDINGRNNILCTPLHMATLTGGCDAVKLLLDNNANVNIRSNIEDIALHYAASNGSVYIVEELIAKGSDVNAQNLSLETPILVSILNNRYEIFKILLNKTDLNIKYFNKSTILHHAVKRGNIKMVNDLINKDIDIDAKNIYLETPLYLAVLGNNIEVVKLLLENGANVRIESCTGDTALKYAVRYKYNKITEELLKRY